MKKECPNGHIYDTSIYGDTCPLCPSQIAADAPNAQNYSAASPIENQQNGPHTVRVSPAQPAPVSQKTPNPGGMSPQDPIGNTQVTPGLRQHVQNVAAPAQQTPSTKIRTNPSLIGSGAKNGEEGRKLVGFLVTYNRTPMGKAYNIYEGRNFLGRDASCDIVITGDDEISGKHMLIRYLSGDGKYRFRDEMSSNGTYVNKQLVDEGELQNYDIIRVGKTLFIFIAIPQI